MGSWRTRVWLIELLLLGVITARSTAVGAASFKNVPVKGMVTMIDLGATSCLPCKLMEPIMRKVKREYTGKAAIIFIDVSRQRSQATRFRVRAIPTQIFFDEEGKEVYRHEGFMSKKDIERQLRRMGVN